MENLPPSAGALRPAPNAEIPQIGVDAFQEQNAEKFQGQGHGGADPTFLQPSEPFLSAQGLQGYPKAAFHLAHIPNSDVLRGSTEASILEHKTSRRLCNEFLPQPLKENRRDPGTLAVGWPEADIHAGGRKAAAAASGADEPASTKVDLNASAAEAPRSSRTIASLADTWDNWVRQVLADERMLDLRQRHRNAVVDLAKSILMGLGLSPEEARDVAAQCSNIVVVDATRSDGVHRTDCGSVGQGVDGGGVAGIDRFVDGADAVQGLCDMRARTQDDWEMGTEPDGHSDSGTELDEDMELEGDLRIKSECYVQYVEGVAKDATEQEGAAEEGAAEEAAEEEAAAEEAAEDEATVAAVEEAAEDDATVAAVEEAAEDDASVAAVEEDTDAAQEENTEAAKDPNSAIAAPALNNHTSNGTPRFSVARAAAPAPEPLAQPSGLERRSTGVLENCCFVNVSVQLIACTVEASGMALGMALRNKEDDGDSGLVGAVHELTIRMRQNPGVAHNAEIVVKALRADKAYPEPCSGRQMCAAEFLQYLLSSSRSPGPLVSAALFWVVRDPNPMPESNPMLLVRVQEGKNQSVESLIRTAYANTIHGAGEVLIAHLDRLHRSAHGDEKVQAPVRLNETLVVEKVHTPHMRPVMQPTRCRHSA